MFRILKRAFYKCVSFLVIYYFTYLHLETFEKWFKNDLISEAFDPIRKLRVENESLTRKIEKISLQRNICFILIVTLFVGLSIMIWKNVNLRLRLTEFNKITNEVATETDGLEIPQPQVTVIAAPECKICFSGYTNNKHPMHLSGCQSKGCNL